MMNRYLAIYNGRNKRFRRDGDEFQREALAWSLAQSESVELVDVRDGRIRREIRKMKDGLDVLAIFDHGNARGLPRMRESYRGAKGLAQIIASVTNKITIIFYACSCGKGWWWNKFQWLRWRKNKRDFTIDRDVLHQREGYAAVLSAELAKLGVEADIWAHLTWGHCCRLPHVARILNRCDPAENIERLRVVKPRTPEWKQWKRDLKGPLRFTFWR